MKKLNYFLIAIVLFASSFKSIEGEFFFDFRTKKEINRELIEARFQLTNPIDINNVKKSLLENKNIKSFNLLSDKDNYFQIRYTNELSLNKLRNTIKTFNTDFEPKSINVKNKKYYNN